MKRYHVTVNGVTYDVTVEEANGASAPTPAAPAAPAAPASKPAPAAPAPAGNGRISVSAPMPGNILSVNVKPGDKVEKGAILCIREARKRENELGAQEAGVVAAVRAAKGAAVQSGDVLVTLA